MTASVLVSRPPVLLAHCHISLPRGIDLHWKMTRHLRGYISVRFYFCSLLNPLTDIYGWLSDLIPESLVKAATYYTRWRWKGYESKRCQHRNQFLHASSDTPILERWTIWRTCLLWLFWVIDIGRREAANMGGRYPGDPDVHSRNYRKSKKFKNY